MKMNRKVPNTQEMKGKKKKMAANNVVCFPFGSFNDVTHTKCN